MGSPVYGGPMAWLAMEGSRRRLAREQEVCEAAPWDCSERGRRWGLDFLGRPTLARRLHACRPIPDALCATDAAVPASGDDLRRLAREVL